MNTKIKLIIVDDHPIFRRGLRDIIEERTEFEIVGEASDGEEGLQLAAALNPDIIVMDLDMPRMSGVQMARALKKDQHPARQVFLTMYNDEDLFNEAMDMGVKGYVLKEKAGYEIVTALTAVSEDRTYYSSSLEEIGRRREDRIQSMLSGSPYLERLTPAEKRILKLISEDRTSKEIAEALEISVKTVDNHRMNICNKLNIHGSHSLLKFAFDHKTYL